MKKAFPIFVAVLLVFTLTVTAYAASPPPKEESVYGILNPDGSVGSIYVVNSFSGGDIKDFGDYSKIQNLITSDKLDKNGDEIRITTAADKLYYQGTLKSKELPWIITVKYILDGKEISGDELTGKSGALKINLSVTQNPKVNSTFFDNYALQIGIKLDTQLCENIKAPDATIAQAGSQKQLNYTVLPGNTADVSVLADVRDFEMDPITINGIKLSMNFNIDDAALKSDLSQLVDAIEKLDNGAGELSDGAAQLSDGMDKYITGMKTLSDGLSKLSDGAAELNGGAELLRDGIAELSRQNATLVSGAEAMQKATFDSVNSQLAKQGLSIPTLTPENYSAALEKIPTLTGVKAQLDGAISFTQGLKSYTNGVSQLGSYSGGLASATRAFKNSVSNLPSSASALYSAGVEINSGLKKLRDGLNEYRKGTGELRSETSSLDSEMDDKINEIMGEISGNGAVTVSFVSEKNTDVSAVQFVLKTPAIEKVEPPVVHEQPVKKTFWQKLLELFGFGKNK